MVTDQSALIESERDTGIALVEFDVGSDLRNGEQDVEHWGSVLGNASNRIFIHFLEHGVDMRDGCVVEGEDIL